MYVLLLAACNKPVTQPIASEAVKEKRLIHIDGFYIDESGVNSNEYRQYVIPDLSK